MLLSSMLREGWAPPGVHLNVISGRGGLGDQIARLPAYRHMLTNYPHVSCTIYVQDYFIDLARHLLPEGPRIRYERLSEARLTMPYPRIEFNMERLTTLHTHLTDHAFMILMDMQPPDNKARSYALAPLVPIDVHPAKMVVFTTDYTAPVRHWPAVYINQLAEKVRDSGATAVLIGKSQEVPTGVPGDPIKPISNDGIKKELFYDLRDKTSLLEALGIIQRARAVVGVDNGLLHLAHCTDVPVVMGFTSLASKHRVPYREKGITEIIEAQVPCKGCQSRGFAVNHDWRTCLFDDYACTLTMTSNRFWEKLEPLVK